MSINTQKQIRDSALELQDFLKDLKQWESKIKEKDKSRKSQTQGVSDLPPVRGHEGSKSLHAVEHTYGGKAGSEVSEGRKRKDKALHDTAAKHTHDYFRDKWDKFDVEAALKEIDENDVPSSGVLQDDQVKKRVQDARKSVNQSHVSDSRFVPQVAERPKAEPVYRNGTPSIVKCQSSVSFVDATAEKEMGNSFFKEKKYVQAIECYSRSIALQPSAVSYANRAMAYIKIRRPFL
ncbi:hypothetical protein KP509_18G004000 [Ceratopteris richardii]|nr:hypothetical protein KP509_18G004000 [Ceratopteris richardii]